MPLGAREGLKVETISTGSIALDLATGIGGIPRGRITELFTSCYSGSPKGRRYCCIYRCGACP